MTISELNELSMTERYEKLLLCCGSAAWASQLNESFPVASFDHMLERSDAIWANVSKEDAMEAFSHHPKIGDIKSLEKKFASTKEWAGNEQSGVNTATHDVLRALSKGNEDYEQKFGYIFIVCATGKSADEMLTLLHKRLPNDAELEWKIAAAEQNKITHIRLNKLIA